MLGRNGSGKSTLLKIIFGTLRAVNSNIRINGRPCPYPYQLKDQVAYLPQHRFLPTDISVRKIINIFIADKSAKQTIKENERIGPHLNKHVDQLSSGELRYLEIMLLLNLDVKFVLMDEPFSGMEPLYKERIAELIKAYRSAKGFIITDQQVLDHVDDIHNPSVNPVKVIAGRYGVSERAIQLRFKKYVGYSPKELVRFLRFKQVVAYLLGHSATKVSWFDLIVQFGYHDQSHLIKDFKHFTGVTPQQFIQLNEDGNFCVGRD